MVKEAIVTLFARREDVRIAPCFELSSVVAVTRVHASGIT
jgi:hypothetical protein